MFFQSSLFVKEISGNCMLLFLRVNIGFLFSGIHSVFVDAFSNISMFINLFPLFLIILLSGRNTLMFMNICF